ncbi:MAG: hypothetical protein KF878_06940 [Planctomycetes bacterium]|nr:hypothetical protein [Planctomycetota bacterium]
MNLGKALGTIGLALAAATYWLVATNWAAIMAALGWTDDGAMSRRYSLVAALCAFAVLAPLLALQLVLERRARSRAGAPSGTSPPAD